MKATYLLRVSGLILMSAVLLVTSLPSQADARQNKNTKINVNSNRNRNTNVNINHNNRRNRNVNVNVNHNHRHRRPIATGVAIGATVAVTAAIIGSVVYTLPPSCTVVITNGISYQRCGNTWYAPQYAGNSGVTYVVVNPM